MPRGSSASMQCCEGESWCAVTCTAGLLSRKWHTILLHQLLAEGGLSFVQLAERIEGISDKVLSESVDDLIANGLVYRRLVSSAPRRVCYELTTAGVEMKPIIDALEAWGRKHLDAGGTYHALGAAVNLVP